MVWIWLPYIEIGKAKCKIGSVIMLCFIIDEFKRLNMGMSTFCVALQKSSLFPASSERRIH
jgi:hypothetical protein